MNRLLAAAAGLMLLWGAQPGGAAELRALVKDHRGKLIANAVILAAPLDAKSALRANPGGCRRSSRQAVRALRETGVRGIEGTIPQQ